MTILGLLGSPAAQEPDGKCETIPFMKSPSPDINNYVVSQALNGFFCMLGEEEMGIRRDPAARVTSLQKEGFAKH